MQTTLAGLVSLPFHRQGLHAVAVAVADLTQRTQSRLAAEAVPSLRERHLSQPVRTQRYRLAVAAVQAERHRTQATQWPEATAVSMEVAVVAVVLRPTASVTLVQAATEARA